MGNIIFILIMSFLFSGAFSFADDPEYTYYSSGKIHTKLVNPEDDADSEYSGYRAKYYYNDEDAGFGYGRVYRTDVYGQGESGDQYALSLEDDSDQVKIDDDPSLDIVKKLTIVNLIKLDEYPVGLKNLLSKGESEDSVNYGLYISESGNVGFRFYSDTLHDIRSDRVLPIGVYAQVAVTYNSETDEVTFYINGEMDSVKPAGGLLTANGGNLLIGKAAGLNSVKGDLRSLSIYDTELTASEINDLYNGNEVKNGLVSRYKFEEAAGSIVYDSEGGNNGQINGADWVIVDEDNTRDYSREILYVHPEDPTDDTVAVEIKTDLENDDVIQWRENYSNGLLKRAFFENGDISEYKDSRVTLFYDNETNTPTYKIYDWDTIPSQVIITKYNGEYTVNIGDPLNNDVIQTEREAIFVYDHQEEKINLDPGTNGWIIGQKIVYGDDGATIKGKYTYDASGRLVRDEYPAENLYNVWEYYEAPNQMSACYKHEYTLSTEELAVTYTYDTIGNLLSISYGAGERVEKYPDTKYWKRKVLSDGSVYEYTNEFLQGDNWNKYGKFILIFELNGYKTWDWGTAQVTLTEYDGTYMPETDSPTRSDVKENERRVALVYDHHNNVLNLDTKTNGWIEREKTIYAADGITVLEKYIRDETGRLIKDIHTDINAYYTYNYHTSAGMEDCIRCKNEYTYAQTEENAILAGADGILFASYEYVDTDYMVKRGADGTFTTLLLDSAGVCRNNTYLSSSNVLHIYNWDDSWNLINVTKSYPDGTVEICTPANPEDLIWPLAEKREPIGSFIKGANLPWVKYGYGLGTDPVTGSHEGFSKEISALYEKMDKWAGQYVRFFLFTDFRAGMNFAADGTPTGFTDFVYEDMRALLDCAKVLNIKLIPVLFDYMIADNKEDEYLAEHTEIINDPVKRAALLNIFKDFFNEFAGDETIYAWDIMNEPEYAVASTILDLQNFATDFTSLIHAEAPDALVTVGSRNRQDMAANWTNVGLDIYQFHYYDSMASAYPLDYNAEDMGLGKPILAGELAATGITNKLDTLKENGYSGGLFWDDPDKDENIPANNETTINNTEHSELRDWFVGTIYTFYEDTQLMKTKTLGKDEDDPAGTIYEYSDDDLTHEDSSSGYGYLVKQINPDGSYKVLSDHFSADRPNFIREYSKDADLLVTYAYGIHGRMLSKTLPESDPYGNVYYSYLDEAFDHDANGTIDADEKYGRIDSQISAQKDADGVIAYKYVYSEVNPVRIVAKKCYGDITFTTLLVTYTYYDDADNLLKSKAETTGVEYEYMNERFYNIADADTTNDYGRLLKITLANGDTEVYTYYGATARVATKTVTVGTDVTVYTYYDDADNLLKSKAETTGVVYEYMNERFYNTADADTTNDYGRLLKITLANGDTEVYTYYGATARV
ncbi:MAG: LamG domain-containing protein, partial [Candidatus Omnitrophota bacterium]